ncbi:type IV pili twitching motility protein PilT [Candidatus Peregrinibacteria bacterium RIFCSPLOWO2_02_FULL_48_14]|nr:MAG: type IV pili twitching motility protein PilT [Candidatus Peregrinibacteria bacterium RIFCSPLOWO2_02_FULL_48_14]
MDINLYLKQVTESKSPDLHLKVGRVPMVRLPNGEIYEMQDAEVMTVKVIEEILQQILGDEKMVKFREKQEVDTSYAVMGAGRFRINAFIDSDGPAIAFRNIPSEIPTLQGMGLPETLKNFTQKSKGLLVVTGPTGSGKSTTLAAMVNEVNMSRRVHIITVEDPIEFVHQPKMALLTQREIGTHTNSFPDAIRAALREDPDVVLVGEMRDLETISAAITLAETGHLVLATLHTQDAAQTIDRMIDIFPSHQQAQVRTQLSTTLLGVVAQRLIPRADGSGRVLALEVLVRNDAITNCIKEGNTHQIYSMMQIGKADGMITLDNSLAELFKSGLISEQDMLLRAHDPQLIVNLMQQ